MKDRFSTQAQQYAAFRPTYPPALYEFLLSHVASRDTAWDAGTGNGQVARDLSKYFNRVEATDISAKQLENAVREKNVVYSIARETIDVGDRSFDLITVAQAIHWFDRDRFYKEVSRVGKPGCVLGVWGYGLLRINSAIDERIDYFYRQVVGPYWDKERRLIDEAYANIAFPFRELKTPALDFSFNWRLAELEGYLETWSSVQRYKQAQGTSPVKDFINGLRSVWGNNSKTVTFPLFMRVGKI